MPWRSIGGSTVVQLSVWRCSRRVASSVAVGTARAAGGHDESDENVVPEPEVVLEGDAGMDSLFETALQRLAGAPADFYGADVLDV